MSSSTNFVHNITFELLENSIGVGLIMETMDSYMTVEGKVTGSVPPPENADKPSRGVSIRVGGGWVMVLILWIMIGLIGM